MLVAALSQVSFAEVPPIVSPATGLNAPFTEGLGRWNLSRLIWAAQASHPSIRSQQALLAAAEVGVESARWQYFPTPSVSVQAASTGQGDTQYGGDHSVTVLALSQPLWTWGRLDAGQDRARAQRDSERAGHDEARLSLALRLVQYWGEWQSAQARQQALNEGMPLAAVALTLILVAPDGATPISFPFL